MNLSTAKVFKRPQKDLAAQFNHKIAHYSNKVQLSEYGGKIHITI